MTEENKEDKNPISEIYNVSQKLDKLDNSLKQISKKKFLLKVVLVANAFVMSGVICLITEKQENAKDFFGIWERVIGCFI